MLPVALVLLAAFMLASIGGRYSWPAVPAVIAAAGLFLLSGGRVGADPATRSLDLVVIASLAVIGLQMAPLPSAWVVSLSPATPRLQDAYALEPFGAWRPLSIHPAATRAGFTIALGAALVFWASREAFARGGSRAAARLLAVIGLACAVVSLAQRATAPRTVLWRWTVPDPRAIPFGPFVDRNQLATWLVLAASVVAGYLVLRVRVHMADRMRNDSRAVVLAFSDVGTLAILVCVGVMLLTLAATLSRSGFIALIAAGGVGASLSGRGQRRGIWTGLGVAAALVAIAAWVNIEGLTERILSTLAPPDPTAVSRPIIWRETLRIIGDFPILGTGVGTFADAMFMYQQTARQVLFNHAHDEYLQLLTEGGLVLLLLAIVGILLLGWAARLRLASDHGPHRFIRIGACAGLAGIAVQSIWETGLRAPANLFLACILAALAVRPIERTLAPESGEATSA